MFANQTGTVILSSESLAYKSSSWRETALQPVVRDQMRIQIVEDVRIEPPMKTIFFKKDSNEFEFKIFWGSGDFEVKIDDAEVAQHVHSGRSVKVSPRKLGSVRLTVRDRKLPGSPPAYANLAISNIKRLDWDAADYLVE